MARQLQEILEEIGLNRREALVYLAVLHRPESSLADIAHIMLIPRMSCYTLLREMLRKGYVDVLVKKRRRYFVAVLPQKIVERHTRRIDEMREALPRFERHARVDPVSPRVRYFEGKEGIRTVFRRILDEKRPFVAIACIEDMEQIVHVYFEEFIRQRIEQNLKVRLLTNRTPASLHLKRSDAKELRETRFVPERYHFHTAEYIFGNMVAILSLKQEPPTALIIEDPEIVKTHDVYFDLLWQQAKNR